MFLSPGFYQMGPKNLQIALNTPVFLRLCKALKKERVLDYGSGIAIFHTPSSFPFFMPLMDFPMGTRIVLYENACSHLMMLMIATHAEKGASGSAIWRFLGVKKYS
jgi:hypothetical protein